MRIAVIGGGASGCFCALLAKRRCPQAAITLFEAGPRLMAKLALTGGGRCNLTNSFRDIDRLEEAYPRGAQLMRRALRVLSPEDTQRWFEAEGVRLTTQEDQCVFPVSQDAMQVVRTLERGLRQAGVEVRCSTRVERIEALPEGGFAVKAPDLVGGDEVFDAVVLSVGGCSRAKLEQLLPEGIAVTETVPSLFTLKIPDAGLRALMGTVVPRATLSLAGTKFRAGGTLLLTDWGVSGPATLRLSSYAARHLAENGYTGTLLVNWLDGTEAEARAWMKSLVARADAVREDLRKAADGIIDVADVEVLVGVQHLDTAVAVDDEGGAVLDRRGDQLAVRDDQPQVTRIHVALWRGPGAPGGGVHT